MNQLIPEKLVNDSVQRITKRYKISKEKAKEFFLSEAFKNRHFMENVLDFYEKKNFFKWKEYKRIMKKTKKNVYCFLSRHEHESKEKIKEKLDELKKELKKGKKLSETTELHKELLGMHFSSKERIPFYEKFYERIFEVTGKPESVLDASLEFNYFSLPFMKLNPLLFVGIECREELAKEMKEYFHAIKEEGIKAKSFLLDLKELNFNSKKELIELNQGNEFNLAFLLKLISGTERKKGTAKKLIELIPAEILVLSSRKESKTKKENVSFKEKKAMQKFIKENSLYLMKKIEFENETVFITKKE
jgi:16S rRNA (guanine(1405)-N(7))-methyltransferase